MYTDNTSLNVTFVSPSSHDNILWRDELSSLQAEWWRLSCLRDEENELWNVQYCEVQSFS